ncbi:MAG TPA: 1-acyl-sn-glycerol-3-phosphate acyltransferase [Solirubrobacteraceae bacterium]|nr:1-acyl-sn-glycerol-3-phosphate acyltransferase [Solirubrobacteraceae bacterium]
MPKLARRLLVAPLILVVEAALVVLSPLLGIVAALASPVVGARALRALAIAVVYAVRHLGATLACGWLWAAGGFGRNLQSPRMQLAHYRVLRWFVAGLVRTMTRLARVDVHVTGSETAERALRQRRAPVVVLSRHAGEGDSLLVVHALLCRYGRRARIVMHEALRLDPLIDMLGHRLPNRFVDPRGGDTEVEIAAMARDLGDNDALLIFPEGGNFSHSRRRRGIERLEQAGHAEEAAWARDMRHVSAPRPGGALAAIDAAPRADVIFLAHVGVPAGLREAWHRLAGPGEDIAMRLWIERADDVPTGKDEQIDWLFGWWRTIDAWIDERLAPAPISPRVP